MKFRVCKSFVSIRLPFDEILTVLKKVLLLTGTTGSIITEFRYLSQTTPISIDKDQCDGQSSISVVSDSVWQFATRFQDAIGILIWIKILWISTCVLRIEVSTVTQKRSTEILELIKDELNLTTEEP